MKISAWALALVLFVCSSGPPTVTGFCTWSSCTARRAAKASVDEIRTHRYVTAASSPSATREVFRNPEEELGDESNEELMSDNTEQGEVIAAQAHVFGESTEQPMNGKQEEATEEKKKKDEPLLNTRTLYEVLGASPDATREELKKKYVKLARATHPDAMVGRPVGDREESDVLFTEVAAAWRILSDKKERKRYDRSLKAKAFTESVEQMAGEAAERVARSAGPAMSRVLEQVAMPFFRKTAGTTMASFNAAAREVKQTRTNGRKVDLSTAFDSAMRAGRQVGRVIDRYELLKKSRELEQLAMRETERSMAIKGELANVMNKRLSLSLRTPNSALTSAEALKLLDGLNTVDSVTLLESIRMKHPLIHEINCLEQVEKEYSEKVEEQENAHQQLQEIRESLWKADVKAKQAVEAELAARKALEEAQRQVIATRQSLMEWNRMYASAEVQKRKSTHEAEKVSLSLERKQERVRTALRRKEEEVLEVRVNSESEDSTLDTLGLSDLERLRKEEEYLSTESMHLDDRAKRFRSRARKLKRRSEELKNEEADAMGGVASVDPNNFEQV